VFYSKDKQEIAYLFEGDEEVAFITVKISFEYNY